jgi:hypothetical protein
MIITDKDTSIMLSADSNPFGLRIKGYDKNGDMMRGIIKIDLVSLEAEQIVFDSGGAAQFDINGNIKTQNVEVDLITIEHPNGSDSLVSRRVVNIGSMNP